MHFAWPLALGEADSTCNDDPIQSIQIYYKSLSSKSPEKHIRLTRIAMK